MTESVRQRSSHASWYARHAEEHNARRQERYANDADVRQKARAQAARYRKKVAAEGLLPRLRDGLYTTARVAAILVVSAQTLRNWEAKGSIPKATNGGKQRLYTEHQVTLLAAWAQAERDGDRLQKEQARQGLFGLWTEQ